MSLWIDTHCHLNDPAFDRDREETIQRMLEAGVGRGIVVGYDRESSVAAVELAQRYPMLYAVVGMHPHDSKDYSDAFEAEMISWLREERVVAVGEIGLDYHYDHSPRPVQAEVFRRQLRLAKALQKPVVIHMREATEDTMRILEEEGVETIGGVMHCFSGSPETAQEALGFNLMISIAGPITFPNARRLPEVVQTTPLDRLLVETDCPYLSPRPLRGKRNEPANLPLVGREIARLLEIGEEDLAKRTWENAQRLFRLP